MKKKVRFFQSVNFKIALAFILILLISIEIIGAYFIRGLENSTIDNFTKNMNQQVSSLAGTVGSELSKKDASDTTVADATIQRILDNTMSSDMIEMRVVDEKGIVRATTNAADKSTIGKKMITKIPPILLPNGRLMKPQEKECTLLYNRFSHPRGCCNRRFVREK